MTIVTSDLVLDILRKSGFIKKRGKRNLFLTGKSDFVTPAFLCNIFRKRGEVKLGGAVGLFFWEFEKIWRRSISVKERSIDSTLPLVMFIENYKEIGDIGVLRYVDRVGLESARHIHDLVCTFPDSIDLFNEAVLSKKLSGLPIDDYLHMFEYFDNDNLYFRKSCSFVHWYMARYPDIVEDLRQCLTDRQLERLALNKFQYL